jgi:hypothetical protein
MGESYAYNCYERIAEKHYYLAQSYFDRRLQTVVGSHNLITTQFEGKEKMNAPQNSEAGNAGTTPPTGDATGGVIPYKNAPALIAYYTGIGSLIPVLGIILGPIAFVLGILGLRKRKRQPEVKGAAHAWIGIVLGFINIVVYSGLLVSILMTAN